MQMTWKSHTRSTMIQYFHPNKMLPTASVSGWAPLMGRSPINGNLLSWDSKNLGELIYLTPNVGISGIFRGLHSHWALLQTDAQIHASDLGRVYLPLVFSDMSPNFMEKLRFVSLFPHFPTLSVHPEKSLKTKEPKKPARTVLTVRLLVPIPILATNLT